jgi:hypothetical protein
MEIIMRAVDRVELTINNTTLTRPADLVAVVLVESITHQTATTELAAAAVEHLTMPILFL